MAFFYHYGVRGTPLQLFGFTNILDLARAKREALHNINYSLFKQNIKLCNAKRRRQRRRTVKFNNRSNQQKKQLCTCSRLFCTVLCRCFARLQSKTSRNIFLWRNVVRVLVHFFFTAAHFLLALVAASISHYFCHRRYKIFMLFFQQKGSPLLFVSRSRSALSFAGLPPTLSFPLSFTCSILHICGHNN